MKLAVLDIGSNSVRLQVVDARSGGPPLPAHAVKEPVLLGEDFQPDGSIGAAGVDRLVDAVRRALVAVHSQSVERLYAMTTSAVRDAANRDAILDRIEAETGVRPQWLTGDQEARLTYLAAHSWFGWSAGRLLVLDIGGGSMEIVLGRDAEPALAVSLPLGAGRLTREFLTGDPPSKDEVTVLRRHIRGTLREVADRLRWEADPARAIGTSKTFKQLARLAGAQPQHAGPFVARSLGKSDVGHWIPRLAKMTTKKRGKLRGVSKARAGQILAGALVAKAAMDILNVHGLDICPWALREGVILSHLRALPDETTSQLSVHTLQVGSGAPAHPLESPSR